MIRNSLFVFFMLSTATILPLYFYNKFWVGNLNFKTESSVWCLESPNICKFKNVCYSPEFRALIFFLGNNSIIKGVTSYNEFQNIQLSSLQQHNQFFANISVVIANEFDIKSSIQVLPKVLVFSRFKPDNIMHVFHDDLFPLFLTLEFICLGDETCMKSYRLVMHDVLAKGPFFHLYEIFSNSPPILLGKWGDTSNHYLCFTEMLTGLVQDSVFYQYGFKKPHGPVKTMKFTQNDVIRFTSFVKERLKVNEDKNQKVDIVVISRQKNRKILNLNNLIKMVLDASQKMISKSIRNVKTFDLNTNSTNMIIKAVSEADILVGMHGAEMIFSLFMKPNSIVVELFPFGIQPSIVSFVKPLSEIKGSYLYYIPWRNLYKNNSVAHPNAHYLLGGIAHLDKTVQEKIINTDEVPPVKCCNNPLYLYHMYQDTLVSDNFGNFLIDSMKGYVKVFNTSREPNNWFYPHSVANVSCEFDLGNKIIVKWHPPFNIQKVNYLKYSLYLKDRSDKYRREFLTRELSQEAELPSGVVPNMQGWISVVYEINNSKSRDLYFECKR